MVTIDRPLEIPLQAHIWDSNMKENQSDVVKIFTCFYSDAVLTPVELQTYTHFASSPCVRLLLSFRLKSCKNIPYVCASSSCIIEHVLHYWSTTVFDREKML